MRPYAERREARIARLRERAARKQDEGEAAYSAAKRIADAIPLGQPILVGHHSEKRARRDADRIHNNMRKGVEAQVAAKGLERRADAAERNDAISSDDPDAIEKLRVKLDDLQKVQERMKALNAVFRKGGMDKLAEIATPAELAAARKLFALCPYEKVPYPGYALINNNANARRVENRIAALEAQASGPASPELKIGDVAIDEQDNRTRIHFPGKPAAAVIVELKASGFRWCRTDACWQRHASEAARAAAIRIVQGGSVASDQPARVAVAPGITAELRAQPSGSIVYTLFDCHSRTIGTEEVFGSRERALACAKAFAMELLAAHQVAS